LQAIQIDQSERALVAIEADTESKTLERKAKALSTVAKTESEVILNLEKAETEQTKNQISKYTADTDGIRTAIEFAKEELDLDEREQENARKLLKEGPGATQS